MIVGAFVYCKAAAPPIAALFILFRSRGHRCDVSLFSHVVAGLHHDDTVFSYNSAGPHNLSVRVRNTRIFPSLEYDSSVAYFPPCPDKAESKQRAKRPPSHCGLKFWLVTTLRATRSLQSLKQALRLTPPAKISPFGHRPPFKWAGSCTSARLFVFRRRGFTHYAKWFCSFRAGSNAMLAVKYAEAGPHPSRGFPACPWKICVAASRLPCLFSLYAGGAEAGECFPFLSCGWNFCVARFRVHPLCYPLSS